MKRLMLYGSIICMLHVSCAGDENQRLVTDPPIDQEDITDEYGGIESLKGTQGDYFHLEEISGRTMLVTPAGNGFLTLGINHIGQTVGSKPYDVIDQHFQGDDNAYIEDAVRNLKSWNYNTVGYHNPYQIRTLMPSMADAYLIDHANYASADTFAYSDVFDPTFKATVSDKIMTMINASIGNEYVIGYYWSDTPQWDIIRARDKRGTDWVSFMRGLSASAQGKQAYIQFLKDRYTNDGSAVQAVYGLATSDWAVMEGLTFSSIDLSDPVIEADDYAFLGVIAEEFYRDMGTVTRSGDPGRLIFGERFLVGDHPQVVIEAAAPWIDVLSLQPGGMTFNATVVEDLHTWSDRPIMLCDHSISFPTAEYPSTMWYQAGRAAEAGQLIAQYQLDAVQKPYIIGYHRCQYISRCTSDVCTTLKQGVLQVDATPYEDLARELTVGNKAVIDFLTE